MRIGRNADVPAVLKAFRDREEVGRGREAEGGTASAAAGNRKRRRWTSRTSPTPLSSTPPTGRIRPFRQLRPFRRPIPL